MLSDITLSSNDFKKLHQYSGDWSGLSEKLFKHPLEASEKIQKFSSIHSKELQEVIECHHEMPDGSGFPRGLDHKRIPLLASIHIVARHFVEELMKVEFNHQKRFEIMDNLYKKFNKGHFKSGLFTIYEFLSMEKPE
ncbi:MAG: hypothetical protein HN509_16565 [Halobacteriovoraceae bacterium]|jgi:HD-GYP domain-containing protein (c-di-GMP phosphodiesterase class II)|nr:hypothetical protein [Halobacteriovoraceae bacterium]MBT5092818.1 hypothetical protein [Halobacteriovoraceae bacterium]